ncbi:MAG: regulatory protein RecX [Nitrospirales bacterium]
MVSRANKPTGRAGDDAETAALRFLARQARTESQVRAFLTRRGLSATRIHSLVGRLVARGYLDDEAFAVRWARARLTRSPVGRERMEAELCGQGVAPALAREVVARLYEEYPESDLAVALLTKRLRRNLKGSSFKAAALLRRAGFDEELIAHCVESLCGTQDEWDDHPEDDRQNA